MGDPAPVSRRLPPGPPTGDDLPDVAWLTEDLATGGDLGWDVDVTDRRARALATAGVVTVVDLRQGRELEDGVAEQWRALGVEHVHLPTDDAHGHHVPAELFDVAVEAAREAAGRGGRTLVHCHMGVNRGPSAAFAVLLDRGWDVVEAFEHVTTTREVAQVAYAEDALRAHHARQGVAEDDERARDDVDRLREAQRLHLDRHGGRIRRVMADRHRDELRQVMRDAGLGG